MPLPLVATVSGIHRDRRQTATATLDQPASIRESCFGHTVSRARDTLHDYRPALAIDRANVCRDVKQISVIRQERDYKKPLCACGPKSRNDAQKLSVASASWRSDHVWGCMNERRARRLLYSRNTSGGIVYWGMRGERCQSASGPCARSESDSALSRSRQAILSSSNACAPSP